MKSNAKVISVLSVFAPAQGLQLLLLILALLLAVGCNTQKTTTTDAAEKSSARQRPGGERPSIDEIFKMDTNQDGKLSKSEVEGPLLRDFDQIDSNDDGFLSRTEVENAPRPQRGQGPPRNK